MEHSNFCALASPNSFHADGAGCDKQKAGHYLCTQRYFVCISDYIPRTGAQRYTQLGTGSVAKLARIQSPFFTSCLGNLEPVTALYHRLCIVKIKCQ